MSRKANPIYDLVQEAIDAGNAVETQQIRELRAKSEKAVSVCKTMIWIGIALINLVIWVPLPFHINQMILFAFVGITVAAMIVVPVIVLKGHQLSLQLLKPVPQGPKKKASNASGRAYIDQVKAQDRSFIAAELELLEGTRWVGPTE